ncbi:hypothetical protein [Mycolicibacterium goodii]|uniref:hypothetical protein n=1 Tax=Mycolicibacterium goodii TaxID=134601 RepID=UPI001BDDC3EA|nr:hypothetical protein [Mycolicibacterium goodii]MBU8833629.1 hypothetical protein [Mycolicibacterium goodii]
MTGIIGFIAQCAVCPQRAVLTDQPDPDGWLCPRCAEVAPSAAEACEIEPPAEFGPHDIVVTVDDPANPGRWARVLCNCGKHFVGTDLDWAKRSHSVHAEAFSAQLFESLGAHEADEDDQPLGEKPPLGGLGGLIGGPW